MDARLITTASVHISVGPKELRRFTQNVTYNHIDPYEHSFSMLVDDIEDGMYQLVEAQHHACDPSITGKFRLTLTLPEFTVARRAPGRTRYLRALRECVQAPYDARMAYEPFFHNRKHTGQRVLHIHLLSEDAHLRFEEERVASCATWGH